MDRREFLKSMLVGTGVMVGSSAFPILSYGAAKKPIKIGLIAPFSGVLSNMGEDMTKGVKLAVEMVNEKGGVLGRKIELVIEDDKTDPAAASLKAKKIVFNDKVDFLMGTISSATTLAVINVIKGTKVPYFWVAEGEDKNCVDGKKDQTRKYVFGVGPTPEQKFEHYIPYLLQNFGKSFYFVGSDYVFPHFVIDIGKDLLKKHGGTTIGEEYGPLGTTDWSAVITKIEKAKPDILFSVVVGSDGAAFVKQAMNFGLKSKMTITGFPSFDPTAYPAMADSVEGILAPTNYSEGLNNPTNTEYVKRYKAKYNPKFPISDISNGGFAVIQFIQAGVEKAGSTDPDKFVKAVEGISIIAPQGEMRINAKNHTTDQHIFLCKIQQGRYDVVKDFGMTIHPDHSGCSA